MQTSQELSRIARKSGQCNNSLPFVNSKGEVAEFYAFGGPEVQRKLLESEGVTFKENGKIDLKKYGIEI